MINVSDILKEIDERMATQQEVIKAAHSRGFTDNYAYGCYHSLDLLAVWIGDKLDKDLKELKQWRDGKEHG